VARSDNAVRSDNAAERYYVSYAESLARRFARALSAPVTLSIRVRIVEPVDPRMLATTVRGESGNGCVLKMREMVLRRPDVVAHETCHCVNDYPLLTSYGYNRSVVLEDVERMESAAERCEEGLLKLMLH
jgi:hypothetical protein